MKYWFLSILVILASALPTNAEPLATDIYILPVAAPAYQIITVRVDEQIISNEEQRGELVISQDWMYFSILTTSGMHYMVTSGNTITWIKDAGVPEAHLYVSVHGTPKPGLQVIARDYVVNKSGWLLGTSKIRFPFVPM